MTKPDQVKLFGGPNWLDIEDNDITRIIMTISQTGSIMEKLKWNPTAGSGSSSNYPFLDNEKDQFVVWKWRCYMKVSDLEGDCVVSRQCQSKRDPNRYGYKRFCIYQNAEK